MTGTVFLSEYAFLSKFWIYLVYCPNGEALNNRPSASSLYEVASHVKKTAISAFIIIIIIELCHKKMPIKSSETKHKQLRK